MRVCRWCILGGTLWLASASWAVDAHAREVGGTVNLGLEGTLFAVESTTVTDDADNSATATDTAFGLAGGGFGPGVGFGLSDTFVLGMRLQLMNSTRTFQDDFVPATKSTAVQFTGTLEVLLGGDAVKPFLGPKLGFRTLSAESGGVEASSSLFMFGAVAGFHGFLVDAVSIDPTIGILGVTGSDTIADVNYGRSGYAFVGGLAITGWLGGSEKKGADEPAEEASEQDMPPEEPEPAPASSVGSRGSPQVEDGVVRAALEVATGTRLFLQADQSIPGSEVEVMLRKESRLKEKDCEAMKFVLGERDVPMRIQGVDRVENGISRGYIVNMMADIDELLRVARRKGTVWLEACGERFRIDGASRSLIRRFGLDVKRLRTAVHGNTPAPAASDEETDSTSVEPVPAGDSTTAPDAVDPSPDHASP